MAGHRQREQILRACVLATDALQLAGNLADEKDYPHLSQHVVISLEALSLVLRNQPMKDEQVTVTVKNGIAQVTSKTEFVNVTINQEETPP